MIDKIFIKDVTVKRFVLTIILLFLSINIFGTVYSFAGIPVIFLIIFINLIKSKKINKHQIGIFIAYMVSILIYFLQYQMIGKGNMEAGSLKIALIGIITNPVSTFKSLIAYNASSIFGFPVYIDKILPDAIYLTIGALITILYIYSVFCFFKSHMYRKTMLPLMLMGYSLFVFLLVLVGRYPNEWSWFVNAWYTVHTKLAVIGSLWILIYSSATAPGNHIKTIARAGILLLVVGVAAGIYGELRRVPYERIWYQAKQPYLFAESINDLPVSEDGNTPLLASPELTMKSINLMREHKLSVYRHYNTYKDLLHSTIDVGTTLKTANKISGYFDDGWLGKTAEFEIEIGSSGELVLSGYYPNEITGNETGTIYIDDKAFPFKITEANFKIELPAKANSIADIKIVSDFSFLAAPPDTRELSFVLSDLQGEPNNDSKIGYTLETANIISGYFDDGWLGKVSEYEIKIGKEGKLVLSGYYPKTISGKEMGTIYVNDIECPFSITEANFKIELAAKANSIANVKIVNNFSFKADPPDTRELCFVLIDMQGK